MTKATALHAIVYGRVQGVYFRAFVENHASELGLTGYVRNLPGGREVEIMAEGDRGQLEKLLSYLNEGPVRATVEKVVTQWLNQIGKYSDFKIEY
jgi:acylphosphatase